MANYIFRRVKDSVFIGPKEELDADLESNRSLRIKLEARYRPDVIWEGGYRRYADGFCWEVAANNGGAPLMQKIPISENHTKSLQDSGPLHQAIRQADNHRQAMRHLLP